MAASYSTLVVCLLAVAAIEGVVGQTGLGTSTRGWDCCKPSCSWIENTHNLLMGPVQSCDAAGNPSLSPEERSGCDAGGTSFTCPDQQPFQSLVNPDISYGFAGANIPGVSPRDACCSCYRLTFPDSPQLSQKEMIVQITNSGTDMAPGQFNILMPGGGVGPHTLGCTAQYDAPVGGWGAQYGGLKRPQGCGLMPSILQGGCQFMFGWFENTPNPDVEYTRVQCPAALVERSGCRRADDGLFPRFRPTPAYLGML